MNDVMNFGYMGLEDTDWTHTNKKEEGRKISLVTCVLGGISEIKRQNEVACKCEGEEEGAGNWEIYIHCCLTA